LDIVEEDEQITHYIALDDELDNEEGLDVFKLDAEFEANEEKYREIKTEILGESGDEGSEADEESSDDDSEQGDRSKDVQSLQHHIQIQDETETNLINLRRTIYLTIMSSLDFEESVHKLMKMTLKPGQEVRI
jgi:pre-mRNA-splicing factor CWC22